MVAIISNPRMYDLKVKNEDEDVKEINLLRPTNDRFLFLSSLNLANMSSYTPWFDFGL